MTRRSLDSLNTMERAAFVGFLGGVFESSPWVAEQAWADRPFASREALHSVMVDFVWQAGQERQLALIFAHPELAGKAAAAGMLTPESTSEQASAGLNRCTGKELAEIGELNQRYRERFGFPFVMAVKGRSKAEILQAFRERTEHSRAREFQTCLEQIAVIARLRLVELVGDR